MLEDSPHNDEAFSRSGWIGIGDTDDVARARTADRLHGAAELVLSLAEEVHLVY